MKTTTAPKTVRPQDDFFSYVNGAWLRAHPIPPTESRWGIFLVLRDNTLKQMRAIYDETQDKDYPVGSIEQQARDFYYTSMHRNEFEASHRKLMNKYLQQIANITDRASLSACVGTLQRIGISAGWSVYVDVDDKDSSRRMFRIHQRVLTLPGREYYLEDSTKMKAFRAAYLVHMQKIQAQFSEPKDPDFAQQVLDFECALAEHSRTKAELRDPESNYNKTTYQNLLTTYQNIDWSAFASALHWQPNNNISVDQTGFLAYVNQQFGSMPLSTWKVYLQWKLLVGYSSLVSEDMGKLQFEFFGKTLSGTKQIKPIWKRSVQLLEGEIGQGVGRLYAERHFPESSKQEVLAMVEEVRTAYKHRINRLDWMTDETKAKAQKKLANMKVLIGYPNTWRDYSQLRIGRDSLIANVLAAEEHESDYYLNKLSEPVSRDEWHATPQTVNAFNNPNLLTICFPAAILQPPFYSPEASAATNFGAIGMTIGHEFTHGFDDEGSQFDEQGNLNPWQTPAERKAFDKRAQLIVDQADHFEVLPGLHLNGKLVLGESIADLGGLEIAYEAYIARLDGHKITRQQKQQFFAAYARTECEATREEQLRQYTLSDPHPASEFRVNGILGHIDAFYDAFDIKPGDKLYRDPETRARIW